MAITINAKGTSVPFFTIGKSGATLYQGSVDPSLIYSMKNGDVWLNTSLNSISSWSTSSSAWQSPQLADLNFTGSSVVAADSADLTLVTTSGNNVVLDAGAGNPVLTGLAGKDLYISDPIGGNLYLNTTKWPTLDGTVNQVLKTDGNGVLGWMNVVTSVAGTSNQIVSSGSINDITLSLPTTLVAPGTLQYTSQLGLSQEVLAAAGTTQNTATLITKTYSRVTTGNAAQGIILPTPSFVGELHIIENCTANVIYIWPHATGSVDHQTTNTNGFVDPEGTVTYIWNGTTWNSITDAIAAGNTGISVTHTGSTAQVSNTGVLSFSAGTTGLTPATSTTGDITLGGTLSIGSGGTNAITAIGAFNNLSPLTTSGDLLYHNGTTNIRLPVGTNTSILSVSSGIPSWVTQASLAVGSATTSTTATNIAGGASGSIFYQTSANTSTALSVGSTNQVLTVVGGVPTWQNVTTSIGYTPVNKAGDTMGGAINMGAYNITNLASPVNPTDAVTKAYVDASASGIMVKDPVTAATVGQLTATYTDGTTDQNTGLGIGATLTNSGTQAALVIDGVTLSATDRVLVKNQSDATENGIYVVTTVGSGSTNWVITRASDYNDSVVDQVKAGDYVLVQEGTANVSTGWINTAESAVIIGTTNILWTQFSSSSSYSAGTGLALNGTTFSNSGVLSVTTGSGLSTNTSATGNVSITNTGVTSVTAGTGITVSSATGSITVATSAPVVQNITANYTVVSTDSSIFANASAGAITVTLPASPTVGEVHNIKKVDNTRLAVLISGNGNNIDAHTSVLVNVPFMSITVMWNASINTWQII